MFKRYKKRLYVSLAIVAVLLIAFLLYFYTVVLPIIIDITSAKVDSQAMAAVNNAVFKTLTEKPEYSDLITIYSDDNGRISMIQADSVRVNALARETSKLSQDSINKLGEQGIDIPLGSLTGSPLLIGQGPMIHIKMTPIGTVSSNFVSEFTEAGINQTRHQILLTVEASVQIVLPITTASVSNDTEVLVCESILVGDVPQTYLEFAPETFLDLLP